MNICFQALRVYFIQASLSGTCDLYYYLLIFKQKKHQCLSCVSKLTGGGTSKSQHDSIKTETDLEHRKSNGNDITGLVLLISHSLLAVQSGGKIWLCDVFHFSFPILIFAPFCLLPGLTQWLRVSLSSNQLRHFFHLPLAILCYSRYERIPTTKKKWAWPMVRVV